MGTAGGGGGGGLGRVSGACFDPTKAENRTAELPSSTLQPPRERKERKNPSSLPFTFYIHPASLLHSNSNTPFIIADFTPRNRHHAASILRGGKL